MEKEILLLAKSVLANGMAKRAKLDGVLSRLLSAYASGQGGFSTGGLLGAILGVTITIIILANAIPVLWPLATTASANITAMTGTDAGTTTMQAFWPVALLIVGLGIGVAVVYYALREFGLVGT